MAKRTHDFIPPAVIGTVRMLRAIKLDDELSLSATEVVEIWTNRELADEMMASEFFRLQFEPKKGFCLVLAMS